MVNEQFFDVIDNEIKAYLLGFITADGTINDSRKTDLLQVHISIKDKYIIELLEEYVGNTVKTYYTKSSVAFRTANQHLCDSLQLLGVHPRKTGNEVLNMDILKSNLCNHYIRGLIDGDGWICNTKIGYGYRKSVGFCSSKYACEQLRNFLYLNLKCYPVEVNKVKNKDNYKINYSAKQDVHNIIDFLYSEANFFLERKYKEAMF